MPNGEYALISEVRLTTREYGIVRCDDNCMFSQLQTATTPGCSGVKLHLCDTVVKRETLMCMAYMYAYTLYKAICSPLRGHIKATDRAIYVL